MIHTITIETDNYYHVLAVTAFAHRLGLSTHVTHSKKITREEQQAAFRKFAGSWEGDETAEEIEAIIDKRSLPREFQSEIDQLWSLNGADKIFQNHKDFATWLNTPNPGLADIAPIHFIKTDIKKIADLLHRIRHGLLA